MATMKNPGRANGAQAGIDAAGIFSSPPEFAPKKMRGEHGVAPHCLADMCKLRFSAHRPITRPEPARAGLGERN